MDLKLVHATFRRNKVSEKAQNISPKMLLIPWDFKPRKCFTLLPSDGASSPLSVGWTL